MARSEDAQGGEAAVGPSAEPRSSRPDATRSTTGGPAVDSALVALAAAPPVEPRDRAAVLQRGMEVGRYVVVDSVGSGGMGEVARAYDPKLRREVAIKRLHTGLLNYDGEARLFREAQAMAQLNHPNVVSVFDVDRTDKGVIMAMELVDGITMRQWLGRRRPWREVLRLMTAAARGLEAAHAAGLTHRDFKPANIMLSVHSQGRRDLGVKVVDFGLARADARADESEPEQRRPASNSGEHRDLLNSPVTRHGRMLGTPAYMAPEQYEGDAADARSDQFSFFVALWEGLWGELPYRGRPEALALSKHDGPPPYPKGGVPRWLYGVVVRGLAVRPVDRFTSMTEAIGALDRDKGARRWRWIAAGTATAALGVAGAGGQAWLVARAEQCSGADRQLAGVWDDAQRARMRTAMLSTDKPYAERAWERSAAELDRYTEAWTTMRTEVCAATTLRGEQSTEVMDLRMACLHRARVELKAATDVLAGADAGVVAKAGEIVAGLADVDRCAQVDALQADVEPPNDEDTAAVEAARVALAQAAAQTTAGRYAEAQTSVEAAKAALVGTDYGPVQTQVALREGTVLDQLGKYPAAEAAWNRALGSAARWRQWSEMVSAAAGLMLVVGSQQGKTREALRYRVLAEGLAKGDATSEAKVATLVAHVLEAQGEYEEAEAELRRALAIIEQERGPEAPYAAIVRSSIAVQLHEQGKYEQAEAEHRSVLALREKIVGPAHPYVAVSYSNLANTLFMQGKYEAAEAGHRQALTIAENALGPQHPHVAIEHNSIAAALGAQKKDTEAEAEYRTAVMLLQRALGPEHTAVAKTRGDLANVLARRGKHEEAEAEHRRTVSALETAQGAEHPDVAISRASLATVLKTQGKYEQAEIEFRRALAIRESALAPDHPKLAGSRTALAELLLERGRADEAVELAEQAWLRQQRDDTPPISRASSAFALARALWDTGAGARARTRARDLAERALADYGKSTVPRAEAVEVVENWLRTHRSP